MQPPPVPGDDAARVAELHSLDILDTPEEERFDRITRTASALMGMPIALVSLVDEDRQWFKSRTGLEVRETERCVSFCAHAIAGDGLMEIGDALRDARFADNPLVTGAPGIRFYAGVPLRSPRGHKLGTLCVIDRVPRALSDAQRTALRDLGCWAEMMLNARDLEAANEVATQTSRQLRAVLDSATDAIIVLERDLAIHTFNKAAEQMFGRSGRSLRGRPLQLLMSPCAVRQIEAALATLAGPDNCQRMVMPGEMAVLRADGTEFIADVRISRTDADFGRRFTMIVRDVTESHMAFDCLEAMNRKIAESLSLQQTILDGTSCAVIACDTEGRIVLFNAGAERMLGYSAEEMLFRETPLRLHDEGEIASRARELSDELGVAIEPGFAVFSAKLMRGLTDEREWTLRRRDGTPVPVLLSLSALRDDAGQVSGFVGIAHDLTETRRLEEMKSDFVATVSHELRTPLTSIKGAIRLLAADAGVLPAPAARLLDIADKNCSRLATMVDDILDLEKMDRRSMQFDCRPHSLAQVIGEAVHSVQPFADGLAVRVDWQPPPGECMVAIDAGRITQVAVNLLSNAIKFSPRKASVSVRIGQGEGALRVSVRDRGPGIPEDFRPRIFKKFAQAGAASVRGHGGSGLGLAISKAIVEQHGGQIGFESTAGSGSEFYFELPCASVAAA